jgi:hypothetical protein
MASMSDELKECNLLKSSLIVRSGCATLDVGHPISLQALCQIFVGRSAWIRQRISRSLASDVRIHCLYLAYCTALLPVIFATFRVLNSIVNYSRSKRVMKLFESDCSKFWEGRNVDISIPSTKIAVSSHVIVCNTMLFIFRNKCFRFLLYPGTTYLCKHPIRFSSIDQRGLNNWLLVPLFMIFTVTSYVGHRLLHCD